MKSSLARSQPSTPSSPNAFSANTSSTCWPRVDCDCEKPLAQPCLSHSKLAQHAQDVNALPPIHVQPAQPDHALHAGHVHNADRPLHPHAKLACPIHARLTQYAFNGPPLPHTRHCHPPYLLASCFCDEEGEGEH